MFAGHTEALVVGYAVAMLAWLGAARLAPGVWPVAPGERFDRPRIELILALLAAVLVLALGQLWVRGIRIPESGPLPAAANQVLVFLPMLLIPVLRRQPWTTAWLPRPRLLLRIALGIAVAIVAVSGYSFARDGALPPWRMLAAIARFDHVDELVQVFLEDVSVAILFVRFAAAIGAIPSIAVVAALFAAGHVPVMLTAGASLADLALLIRDAALGALVIGVLRRSRDVVWFVPVHFCLDMTQFDRVAFGA